MWDCSLSSNPSALCSCVFSPRCIAGTYLPEGRSQTSPHLQPLRSQRASLPCQRNWAPRARTCLPQRCGPGAPQAQTASQASHPVGRKECLGTDTVRMAPRPERKKEEEGSESLLGSISPDCRHFFSFEPLKFLLISLSHQPAQCGPPGRHLPKAY